MRVPRYQPVLHALWHWPLRVVDLVGNIGNLRLRREPGSTPLVDPDVNVHAVLDLRQVRAPHARALLLCVRVPRPSAPGTPAGENLVGAGEHGGRVILGVRLDGQPRAPCHQPLDNALVRCPAVHAAAEVHRPAPAGQGLAVVHQQFLEGPVGIAPGAVSRRVPPAG